MLKKVSSFPPWLKKRIFLGESDKVKIILRKLNLHTVCEEAGCPNRGECFAKGRATFMLLGDTCTRNCRFCGVKKGVPLSPDSGEPQRIAKAARELGLKHIVITSVTRDDLKDGGAEEFANVIIKIRKLIPQARVEVLTPDFEGLREAIRKVVAAKPDIFNHNVETVPRLYSQLRPQAEYKRSLKVLEEIKKENGNIYTKSGLMLGLGEKEEEVLKVMKDLRESGCDILTLGQYLSPSKKHYPVYEFIHPDVFNLYKVEAEKMGFFSVSSGPFVRSSYYAEEVFNH